MLPMLLRVKYKSETRSFGFYFPLILLYILLIPIAILGICVFVLLLIIPDTNKQAKEYMPIIMALPELFSASIGTTVDIQTDDTLLIFYIM